MCRFNCHIITPSWFPLQVSCLLAPRSIYTKIESFLIYAKREAWSGDVRHDGIGNIRVGWAQAAPFALLASTYFSLPRSICRDEVIFYRSCTYRACLGRPSLWMLVANDSTP